MTTRRDFLRKATLGSAALTSGVGLSALNARGDFKSNVAEEKTSFGSDFIEQAFPGWEVSFEESTSSLVLKNGLISIQGRLKFVSGINKWTVARSRDGVPDRYVFVDLQGDVQGYFVCNRNCDQLQLFFYHRTAQAYQGTLSFEGNAIFKNDSFACRTRAKKDEPVLSLRCGPADSLLNDSLFSPEDDLALRFDAANLRIETVGPGSYLFAMSGQIGESSEAIFILNLEKNYFKSRYVPYYHPLDRKRCTKAPTGWMSWNTYFDKATAEDNLAEARIGQKYLQPFGCEFWSIESWQGNSDQLPVRDFYNLNLEVSEKKFPKGMKQLADDIRKLGFRPGLWTAPFGTGNKDF
ncbi:MAG: twin-arginine translocation signal domain-containing protein, partial [Bacteroidetes bacterium]